MTMGNPEDSKTDISAKKIVQNRPWKMTTPSRVLDSLAVHS
jgi:hypothetical protein